MWARTDYESERTLIIVSQVFYPDSQSTGVLLAELARGLSSRGFKIRVLSAFPVLGSKDAPEEEDWSGISIVRGGFKLNAKKSLWRRLLVYFSYCGWLVWKLLMRTPTATHVLVITNPPFAPIVVFFCSLLRGWTYGVLLHDIYPDGLVALGQMREKGLLTKAWRLLNRCTFHRAMHAVVLGRDMRRLCEESYGLDRSRVAVIPNWSSVASGSPILAEESVLWKRLGLNDEFVVQYSGNMGLWHDMNAIIGAAEELRDHRGIRFLLVGDGLRRAGAEALCRERKLDNVIWLPFQPKEALWDSLACCHVAVVSQRAKLAGVAVPSKLYGILASGRAILAHVPVNSEVAEVIREECCGQVVPAERSGAALASVILEFAADPERTRAMGERARAAATRYQLHNAVESFSRLLKPEIVRR